MPKNHGRIVSIFSSHKDRCPSFYHSDLHAKFQPIPTGAIREIAPLGFGGKSQLFVTKPAGPLPRRLYETIWRCHARPPSQAGVPPGQELPSCHSNLPFVLLTFLFWFIISPQLNIQKQTHTHTHTHAAPASRKSKFFENDVCHRGPFRLGLGSSSKYGSLSIDYDGNCLAGDKPLRQFLFGLKSKK